MRKEKVKLIDAVIVSINERLEEDWSMAEAQDGRVIDIKEDWGPVIKYIVSEYRKNGWTVSRHAEVCTLYDGAYHYLKFINPNYLEVPKEIRDTGVRLKSRPKRKKIN